LIAVPRCCFAWLAAVLPLGIWPGVHPLDHPQPWPGRVALSTAGILVPLIVAMIVDGRADPHSGVNWVALAATICARSLSAGPLTHSSGGRVAIAGWMRHLSEEKQCSRCA
jgi:hypothetical protein